MPEPDNNIALTENEFLSRIAAGEESAFKHLFDLYKNRIFGYTLTITNSHHKAEEITQELFIKLWTSRHLLKEVKNLDNYLFVMAKLRTISFLRDAISAEKKLQKVQQMTQPTSQNQTEEKVVDAEYGVLLNDAVSALSPQRKQVYLLSREEGMKIDEISAHLNLSRNTIKNHLVEALKQIRAYLATRGIGVLLLWAFFQNKS